MDGHRPNEHIDALDVLAKAPPVFILPGMDFRPQLLTAISAADEVDCMMGFFASSSLAEIAPGLATFLRNSSAPIRLLISPFVSAADQEALSRGEDPSAILHNAFTNSLPSATDLAQHTLDCLSWLIRLKRLEVRFALLRHGIFHPKVWLLNISGHRVAFHGSSNMTGAGLRRNKEQVALSRSWVDDAQERSEQILRSEFSNIWDGDDDDCTVVSLPRALEEKMLREYGQKGMPEEAQAEELWQKARGGRSQKLPAPLEISPDLEPRGFHIPEWMKYREGAYCHQGKAVDAWMASSYRGVLAMATGSGKTNTALIACHELKKTAGKLLIVVAAPYVPLILQWCDEVRIFGVEPRNLTTAGGPAGRRRAISEAARNLSLGIRDVEVLVVSHDTLTDEAFHRNLQKIPEAKVLIADEMHNLGAPGFLSNPPDLFEYRLGLSATPIRQYDPEGTDRLFSFFGPTCFEFSLDEAIGVCLVPYDYHVHRVELAVEEMDDFINLTEEIRKLAWKLESGGKDPVLDNLLRRRRLVVERAQGKIRKLGALLDGLRAGDLRYDLVYATDKDPSQLDQVNELLRDRGLLFHQITQEETRDREAVARILRSFQQGELQVLTAKRVLDEGVNVPQIKRAFILASTTVERQWTQRRGRILRRCDPIGKDHGVIHDFVVMPPKELLSDPDAKQLVRGELKRVEEFARLARNYGLPDGPLTALEEMQEMVY